MFIGHFAAALAAKKIDNKPSLGVTVIAAQWLDLLWPVLLLTGTEKVMINNDPAAAIPLSFTDYPISHSLLMVLVWSLLFGSIYFIFSKNLKSSILIGALVLSHWVLDWLVHVPDLPLSPFGKTKVGLGLWNYKYLELAVELLFFAAAVYLYLQTTAANNKKGAIGFWSLIIFLVVVHVMNFFGPPPPAVTPVVITGLSQWLLVWWVWWADKNRRAV
jgi:hypothetical protein